MPSSELDEYEVTRSLIKPALAAGSAYPSSDSRRSESSVRTDVQDRDIFMI